MVAYEYVADSEECNSESTHEATQQTLLEPVVEQVAVVDEDLVMMADVQWCLTSLAQTDISELAPQFTLDTADGQKLTEHDYTVEQLVKPNVIDRTHTLVQQQTQRFEKLPQLSLSFLLSISVLMHTAMRH